MCADSSGHASQLQVARQVIDHIMQRYQHTSLSSFIVCADRCTDKLIQGTSKQSTLRAVCAWSAIRRCITTHSCWYTMPEHIVACPDCLLAIGAQCCVRFPDYASLLSARNVLVLTVALHCLLGTHCACFLLVCVPECFDPVPWL